MATNVKQSWQDQRVTDEAGTELIEGTLEGIEKGQKMLVLRKTIILGAGIFQKPKKQEIF